MLSIPSIRSACVSVANAMPIMAWTKADTSQTLPTQNSQPFRSGCQSPNNVGSIGWPQPQTSRHGPRTRNGLQSTSHWNTSSPEIPPSRRSGASLTSYMSSFRGKQEEEDIERGSEHKTDSFEAISREPGSDEADRLLEEGRRFGGEPSGRCQVTHECMSALV